MRTKRLRARGPNSLTRRILCVPADYSTQFFALAMKAAALKDVAKRLSQRYNAVVKCRVFKAFHNGPEIVRRPHPVRPRPGMAKTAPTGAFLPFFQLIDPLAQGFVPIHGAVRQRNRSGK